jgi:hypothetical protein
VDDLDASLFGASHRALDFLQCLLLLQPVKHFLAAAFHAEHLRILRRERDGGMEGLLMAMATGYDYRKYQRVKALEKKGSK